MLVVWPAAVYTPIPADASSETSSAAGGATVGEPAVVAAAATVTTAADAVADPGEVTAGATRAVDPLLEQAVTETRNTNALRVDVYRWRQDMIARF